MVELYFEDSAGKVEKLAAKLAAPAPDFNEVDQLVHQFKGSSASFGAQAIAALCVQARPRCRLLAVLCECPSSCRPLQVALKAGCWRGCMLALRGHRSCRFGAALSRELVLIPVT